MFNLPIMEEKDARNLDPQVQAFVGDGVYSLYTRHKIFMDEKSKGKNLHSQVTSFVKAKGQSNFIAKIQPILTEIEMAVFKRARNHKTLSQAKNQNIVDYKRATGLEALLGYLYLSGQTTRLNELLEFSVGEESEN